MENEDGTSRSLMIGTPAYDGCSYSYMMSLVATLGGLHEDGIEAAPYILPSVSIISHARNEIGRTFQLSGMDYLLAVDSDIRWELPTVQRMLARAKKGAEFIVALPPLRQFLVRDIVNAAIEKLPNPTRRGRNFAIRHLGEEPDVPGRLDLDDEGFGKIQAAGLAFALVHKSVFTKLAEAHPELRYRAPDKTAGYALYNPMVRNEHSFGEDMSFCQRWRDLGGDIWLLADAPLGHEGPMYIEGNYAENIGGAR
jgi:hypothetical protein